MFSLNRFVNKFGLLFKIFLHFIALSDSASTPAQSWVLKPGHAKAGTYSWDKNHTCGLTKATTTRIVDGTEAELGEFPWMASMFVTLRPPPNTNYRPIPLHRCGAVIISEYWLLTASNCLSSSDLQNAQFIDFYVGSKYKHESFINAPYNEMANFKQHLEFDIVLIRVKTKIKQSLHNDKYRINPVCLPATEALNVKQEDALLSGFGQIDYNGKQTAWTLRKARYLIDTPDECKKLNITKEYICAHTDKHITCFGDPGSPLVQFDGDRAVLIGVVSRHGPDQRVCGVGWVVFVRVSQFIGWIKETIESDTPQDWTPSPKPLPIQSEMTLKPDRAKSDNPETTPEESPSSHPNPLNHKTISIFILVVLLLNIFIYRSLPLIFFCL